MEFEEFERRAHEAFDEIPPEFRERVSPPVVVREAKRDKDLRGRYTLGECQHAPAFAGGGDGDGLQSAIFLYYGSFAACARRDPAFDWEEELVETVRHEVQHHVEDQVGHAGLRDLDWAEEQNERRRQGRDHRANYWRGGEKVPDDAWELRAIGPDVFLEMPLAAKDWEKASAEGLTFAVGRRTHFVKAGELTEDEEFLTFAGAGRVDHGSEPGDLIVIVRRRRGLLGGFRKARK